MSLITHPDAHRRETKQTRQRKRKRNVFVMQIGGGTSTTVYYSVCLWCSVRLRRFFFSIIRRATERVWVGFLLHHRPKPQATGLRALALGGKREVSVPLLFLWLSLVFLVKKPSSFWLPKSRKNDDLRRSNWTQKLHFSGFGGHWFQTLIFQVFFSISLPWAWALLRIFNICSPKHCKNLGFLQVFVGFRPNARFRGWHPNPSFGGP